MCFFQVIAAEGEQKASRALKEASDIISESPAALQLRYRRLTLCVHLMQKPYRPSPTGCCPLPPSNLRAGR
jgi:hypothetical protein